MNSENIHFLSRISGVRNIESSSIEILKFWKFYGIEFVVQRMRNQIRLFVFVHLNDINWKFGVKKILPHFMIAFLQVFALHNL